MKTAVTSISIQAFHSLQASSKQKDSILACPAIVSGVTRREIAAWTGMETSTVSARVNALLKEHRLVIDGVKECTCSGKIVENVRLPYPGQIVLDLH